MLKWLGTLRARLLLGSLIPVLLFLGVSLVAFLTILTLLRTLDLERQSNEILAKARDVRATQLSMEAAKRGHHLVDQPALQDHLEGAFRDLWKQHEQDLAELAEMISDDATQLQRVQKLAAVTQDWYEAAVTEIALFTPGAELGTDRWRALLQRLHIAQGIKLSEQLADITREIIEEESRVFDAHHCQAQDATRESVLAIGLTLAGVILLAVIIPLKVAGAITAPVLKLQDATDQLLRGAFSTLRPEGPTEVARLMSNFNAMGLALAEREALLRTSERRYEGLVGSMTHVMWTHDAEGKLVESTGWQAFAGLSEEEARNGNILQAVYPDDRERVERRWQGALVGQTAYEDEFRIRRHDGNYRWVSFRCVPIFTTKSMLLEWVGAAVDVTERREQEELRNQMEAAAAANLAKTAFLTKMSHELRTPLNAIIGMSKMLTTRRFGELTPKQSDYLADITQAGDHLLRLINDVLDLARVEAGRLTVHTEAMEAGATVAAVLSPLRTLAETKKQHLSFKPLEPDGSIQTDPDRFKQVLYNLVSNAIKFTPERGRVVVRAAWVDGITRKADPCSYDRALGLRIEVEDTGVGVPADELESIWDEFGQASNRGTSEGTGLGLALVRRMVALLDGEVGVRSTPGQGSCFWFVLPRDPAETLSTREAADFAARR